jgi:hypothetical protein
MLSVRAKANGNSVPLSHCSRRIAKGKTARSSAKKSRLTRWFWRR